MDPDKEYDDMSDASTDTDDLDSETDSESSSSSDVTVIYNESNNDSYNMTDRITSNVNYIQIDYDFEPNGYILMMQIVFMIMVLGEHVVFMAMLSFMRILILALRMLFLMILILMIVRLIV